MIGGTGPPPPLGDHPNGIDISHPNYLFDSVNWHETPKQFNEGHVNADSMTLRTKNDMAYKSVGNPTTWNQYVSFGYHAYDHCFQFETQWERMQRNESDTLKFIWASYCYQTSRALPISTQLEHWAKDIAYPYLLQHSPSAIHVDTTDPRQARKFYEEPELMEIDDDDSTNSRNKKRAAKENEWKEVQGKNKTRAERDAILTPLPTTPTRTHNNTQSPPQVHETTETPPQPPSTPPSQTPPSTTNPIPHLTQPLTQPPTQRVSLNDGTLRVTVRWKPDKFDDLCQDDSKWNLEATDTVHYILATVSDAILFPWMNGTPTSNIPSLDLTPDNILKYLAPRVTTIESLKMFVFSFRLCLSSGPGKWINNPATRKNFEQHKVEVNLSNSSSDSGESIATAGYIFFKHPKLTQRVYFLSHLRRNLPESTPFFDIGFHKKTPTGQDIPHLTVRCGENHVGPLTEILSAFLDGTTTTVFLGRLLLSKMSTTEVDAIFQTHAEYLTNTRMISMAPSIKNLDNIRTETLETGNINRSTREWATSLKDTSGNSLRCDAENGGPNRRAQLLVPVEHLELVEQSFKIYRESVSTFNQREAEFTTLIQDTYPEAIYVPTRAVHNNLSFIQKRSSGTIWAQAPPAVRAGYQAGPGYRPPTMPPTHPPKKSSFPSANRPSNVTPTMTPEDPKTQSTSQTATAAYSATDETATTHSQMTKSQSTTQNRFHELESSIRRQQTALTNHNVELQKINERAITTLDLCQMTSTHVLELREDTTNQLRDIRENADAQAREQRESFARMTELIANLNSRLSATSPTHSNKSSDRSSDSSSNVDQDSDSMSTKSHEATPPRSSQSGPSPRVKKDKRKANEETLDEVRTNLNPKNPPPDQDKRAQYNEDRTPDAGDT
jgi:hypothetical protein